MLDQPIRAALRDICDPCSIAAGRPTSIIDMGLVTGWTLADGVLTVTFCVTFPGCTMAPHFTEAARDALSALPGVARVEVVVDTDHVWTPPASMAPARPMTGTPQAWRARISRG